MEKIENRKIAEQIISHMLGRRCRVDFICEPEHDHMVKAALRNGASIIGTEDL